MRSFLLFVFFLFSFTFGSVLAYTFQQGDIITVTSNSSGDVYLSASLFHHDTTTLGDIFSFSESATIDGIIEEDLFVFSQSLDSLGSVGDDAYIVTKDAQFLDGEIAGDLFLVAESVTFAPQFRISGSCVVFAREVFIQGEFFSCRIVASTIWIDALFQDNLSLLGENIYITPQSLLGSLHYASPVSLDESLLSLVVVDDILFSKISSSEEFLIYFFQGWKVYHILFTIFFSLVLLVLFPQRRLRVGYTLTDMTLASVVAGFLRYIFLPIFLLVLLFTILGIPVALFFGFLYLLSLLFFEILIVCTMSKGLVYLFYGRPPLLSAGITFILVISLSGLFAMIPYNLDILLGIVVLGACLVTLGRK